MMEKEVEVFITKYALTERIYKKLVKIKDQNTAVHHTKYGTQFFNKNEFHLTLEEAIKDVEKRRLKKISSLKKQIEKLEKMKFYQFKELQTCM